MSWFLWILVDRFYVEIYGYSYVFDFYPWGILLHFPIKFLDCIALCWMPDWVGSFGTDLMKILFWVICFLIPILRFWFPLDESELCLKLFL